MRTFIISLEENVNKQKRVISECEKWNLNYEVIKAVNGKLINPQDINCYPDSYLTPGEIGCSLSHINIYREIVRKKIAWSLVLEDDVLLQNHKAFIEIQEFCNSYFSSPTIILLNENNWYLGSFLSSFKGNATELGRYVSGTGSYGYLINYSAACELYNFLIPIRFEADFWRAAVMKTKTTILVSSRAVVTNFDKDQAMSDIEAERCKQRCLRSKKQAELFNKECKTLKYKYLNPLMKLSRPFHKQSK